MIASLDQFQDPRPAHIDPQHWQEWLDSGVDPDIIAANVRSLSGEEPYDYLCCSEKLERTNTGRLASKWLKSYGHVEDGGWWCSGLDPLNDWQPMLWGCFKPNLPRWEKPQGFGSQGKEKRVKYEHPPKTQTRAFFLAVPDHVWEQVAERYSKPISEEDRQHSFWWWAWKYNVPTIIIEGAKKAGCLLSCGYAAIALPGIWNGRRKATDTEPEALIPELQHFATLGREVHFCFDYETKWKTRIDVENAITKTGRLFKQSGCEVKVIQLPGSQKGADDFIVAQGSEAFEEVYNKSLDFEVWQAKRLSQLNHPVKQIVNRRYLGDIDIPSSAKLIGLKSPKGTGKTESFINLVDQALSESRRVLLIGHRVQLVQAICDRLGLPYVTELKSAEEGATLGFGLCIDSMHPNSQARFSAGDWKDALVLIDESEQVFQHLLNSNTDVRTHRVEVISQIKQLFQNVIASDRGQIVLSDADLSDVSIDFVKGLAGVDVQPWIMLNRYLPKQGCKIHSYEKPQDNYQKLIETIEEDTRVFISVDGQKAKSKWGTQAIETDLRNRFPSKKVLRIDSETVSNPNHSAYGCVSELNSILGKYDIVIASPSLETGVSIDLRGHFGAVFDFALGVSPADAVRQRLFRVREGVDRHIYIAECGLNRVGNGSSSVKSLLASQHRVAKENISLLTRAGMEFDAVGGVNVDTTALNTWAKMAARVNAGMSVYRETVLQGLREEGHTIIQVAEAGGNADSLKASRDENYQQECAAIQSSEDISEIEFKRLTKRKSKTKGERYRERKYELKQRYQVDVTNELIELDDDGWYPQLKMHYYLTLGREFLRGRDKRAAESTFHEGKSWLPDLNQSQLGTAISFLDKLGLLQLLNRSAEAHDRSPDQEWSNVSEELKRMAQLAIHNRWQIRAVLGVTIREDYTPIQAVQKLLSKLGLKLECLRKEGPRGSQVRIYALQLPEDGREAVFQAWLERDSQSVSDDTVVTNGNRSINNLCDYQVA